VGVPAGDPGPCPPPPVLEGLPPAVGFFLPWPPRNLLEAFLATSPRYKSQAGPIEVSFSGRSRLQRLRGDDERAPPHWDRTRVSRSFLWTMGGRSAHLPVPGRRLSRVPAPRCGHLLTDDLLGDLVFSLLSATVDNRLVPLRFLSCRRVFFYGSLRFAPLVLLYAAATVLAFASCLLVGPFRWSRLDPIAPHLFPDQARRTQHAF